MTIADLKDTLRQQLTPRRRRYGLAIILAFLVWSLVGLLVLPGAITTLAKRFVTDKLHLELTIRRLDFNPWMLSVSIEGLSVREPGAKGEVLVAADRAYVNAQLWSSLWWRGASLADVKLQSPYVNARIRKDGSINLMQLVPPKDPEDTGDARWRIGRLAISQGRIAFHDDTRPTPFSTTFAPLNVSMTDLTSRPDRDGLYTLHAATGDGEALDWRGNLAMQPVRSEGELRITGLRATTPWRYLQDQLPLVVKDGTIDVYAHYTLKIEDGAQFALTGGHVAVNKLALHLRGEDPLALHLGLLDLSGLRFAWPSQDAGFTALTLKELQLTNADGRHVEAGLDDLVLATAGYRLAGQQASLASVTLSRLHLADGEAPALLTLPSLELSDIAVGLAARTAHVSRIQLKDGRIEVRREHDGRLNWQSRLEQLAGRVQHGLVLPHVDNASRLAGSTRSSSQAEPAKAVPAVSSTLPKTNPPKASPAWTPTLDELDLTDFTVAISDHVPTTPFSDRIEHINLRLLPRQQSGQPHRVEGGLTIASGGTLALAGTFSEQPLSAAADVRLEGLRLPPLAPYFTDIARFALESGALDVNGHLTASQGKNWQSAFQGQVAVRDFTANDLDLDERFLAWKRLAADGIQWQLTPGRLAIHEIVAERPFTRLIVGADKTLNLSHIIVAAPDAAPATTPAVTPLPAGKPAAPYPLKVDRIRVRDGAMLFADFTLKPQFATGIQSLDGDITGISSTPGSRATIALKGRVDQFGKADISGTLDPLAGDHYTDLKVRFSDLELTTLTPYSAKFAGYRIDKGKLNLDLGYLIQDRKLQATNKVVLNQLTLGDKVDSPDAVNLPLKLAVAILKDKDGVIDIDLPLSGSLDDPQFRVAPLVWKAFVNLLTKAATAPFTLIAGLVGGGDDMDSLAFASGDATLAPEEADKLGKLARALAQRPALGVEIRGAYDPVDDAKALRASRFDAAYQKRLAAGGKPRKVLEAMFEEKLGSEALARQRALSLKPAGGETLAVGDDAYQAGLRDELVARETVLDGDLRQLALERARALRSRLVDNEGVDAARIFVLEPVTATANHGKVVTKVTLNAS
ncbi:MAG TPA: DUF748 domain-containing protein [Moraxellaceae bacterium]|nr:DUF748 domain-containing protein [Moraxellaceae bacterium]